MVYVRQYQLRDVTKMVTSYAVKTVNLVSRYAATTQRKTKKIMFKDFRRGVA